MNTLIAVLVFFGVGSGIYGLRVEGETACLAFTFVASACFGGAMYLLLAEVVSKF